MARVIYSPYVTELIGSIGGITFQRNSSGSIARLKARQTQNPSPLQANQQHIVSELVVLWNFMLQSDKDLWNAFALTQQKTSPWGELKTLNGFQWFMSCNLYRMLVGRPYNSQPQTYVPVSPPDPFVLTVESGDLFFDFGMSVSYPNLYLFVYLSLPLRTANIKLRRSMFLIDKLLGFNGGSYSIKTDFENLSHMSWIDFYGYTASSLICRLLLFDPVSGYSSSFTSAQVGINTL